MKNAAASGIALVLCAAVLWGTTGTAQSFAPAGLSPYLVGALRLALAALFFALYLLLTRPWLRAGSPGLPWRWILLAGLCIAAYNLCFFAGVKASSVAVGTAVAIGSGPIWAGLLQFLLSGQAPRAVWWWGTLLAVAGGSLMVVSGAQGARITGWGIALCLGAGLSYAAYALINKRLVAQAAPALVTAGVFTVAALIALPLAWRLSEPTVLGLGGWGVVGYLGIVATGVSYLLFSSGLRHVSGATGVTLALGEPLTAFLLAIVVVGERPGLMAFAGLALVLAGLALVIRAELRLASAAAGQ
ncbi:DMT family transporter [Variovorax terrae]|uniref:EamA family transporter n=1 Tax=Variovorax terrae TaxID=2923278 RepID=A0A9X1VUR3_9BURK|nr:EamA family transporter [Variovorax terrae]MCJ0763737.1 EamA family transporter [Variovorax terrae]